MGEERDGSVTKWEAQHDDNKSFYDNFSTCKQIIDNIQISDNNNNNNLILTIN